MEQLIKDIKCYVDLRIKKFKLVLVEHMSQVFANLLSFFAVILLAMISVMLFTGALTMLVYKWVGSLVWAFVIMGGFMAVVAAVIYMFRNKLFTGSMVGTFSRMLFRTKTDEDDDDYEEDQ